MRTAEPSANAASSPGAPTTLPGRRSAPPQVPEWAPVTPARRSSPSTLALRLAGALALGAVVVSSALLAAGSASHPNYYVPGRLGGWPSWLAGPFQGLGLSLGHNGFQTLTLLMGGGYLVLLLSARVLSPKAIALAILVAHVVLMLGPPADLPGRIRLPRLCAPRCASWPRPLLARPRAGRRRPDLPLPRLALLASSVRTALHPAQLRLRAARSRRRGVGVQGARRAREPARDLANRPRRRAHGPLGALRRGVRGSEPGAARARRRRRSQRHARAAPALARVAADGRAHRLRQGSPPRPSARHRCSPQVWAASARARGCRRLARDGGRDQGLRGPRPPLPARIPHVRRARA